MTPAMPPTPNTSDNRAAAMPVGGPPTRRKWLLPLLLGLLAVIALLLLLSQCGDDDSEKSGSPSPTTAAPTATTPTATTPSGAAGDGETDGAGTDGTGTVAAGTVAAGGANLLEAGTTAATMTAQNGQQAVGRAVRVLSVPADEGFWVGSSEQDRVWVQLTDLAGESGYKVKEGDSIDFTGTVTAAAKDFAGKVGVTADEGAEQLTSQAHYVSVPASSVKLSD